MLTCEYKKETGKMEEGLISIIIPVYNVEQYIEETIYSVHRQTYQKWELFLVEDHSTDHTMQVMQHVVVSLSDKRIHILENEGKGAADARNTGVYKAKGRYIAYLDADDIWKSQKLELELSFMQQKEAGFVFTGYEFADDTAKGTGRIVHVPPVLEYRQALGNTTIFTSTVLLDRKKIEENKMIMPQIKSEDTATWWQILKTGVKAYGLDENLVLYRRAGKSLSSNKVEALRRIWNLYRKAAHLSVISSCGYFILWALRAVKRRI